MCCLKLPNCPKHTIPLERGKEGEKKFSQSKYSQKLLPRRQFQIQFSQKLNRIRKRRRRNKIYAYIQGKQEMLIQSCLKRMYVPYTLKTCTGSFEVNYLQSSAGDSIIIFVLNTFPTSAETKSLIHVKLCIICLLIISLKCCHIFCMLKVHKQVLTNDCFIRRGNTLFVIRRRSVFVRRRSALFVRRQQVLILWSRHTNVNILRAKRQLSAEESLCSCVAFLRTCCSS